ncbi:MAG: serine hydrolase domain-containing protein [Planctomycetota bacterium]
MNRHVIIHLVASLLLSSFLAQTLPGQTSLKEQFSGIAGQAAAKNFSGIVVAEKNGSVLASQSFGYADAKSMTPIDSKTLFEIASVTKPFTSLAIIRLELEGKLSLDDSIGEHLPNVPDNCRDITIRHLMQHTSGIPGTNYGPHNDDIGEVTKAYLRGGPKQKPGTRFEYWNQGYALLAAIISVTSKQTYQDAMQNLVLRPTKMNASCFTGDKPSEGLTVSTGRSTRGPDRSAVEHPYGISYGLQYQGMGGLVSNTDDLVRFVETLRESKPLLEKILQPGPNGNYGLGWRIEKLNDTDRRVFHSGAVRGFLAAVSWYPEHDSSIIVLANTDDGRSFSFIETSCRRAFEANAIPLPIAQSFNEDFRDAVVGQFTLGSRVITVSEAGEGLRMIIDWGGAKTFGKLAKSEAEDRLRYLDGSDDDISVSFEAELDEKYQTLILMDRKYIRRK